AGLGRHDREIIEEHMHLIRDQGGGQALNQGDDTRGFGDDAGNGIQSVATQRGDGFNISLNASTAGRIRSGDGQYAGRG
ncbi:MAG: hypothetical protein JWO08_3640, partial [Verrucomicrobiaceae bacterium]|nr:hypothetical protein [Verrucomicrobiaceae bacterium]